MARLRIIKKGCTEEMLCALRNILTKWSTDYFVERKIEWKCSNVNKGRKELIKYYAHAMNKKSIVNSFLLMSTNWD